MHIKCFTAPPVMSIIMSLRRSGYDIVLVLQRVSSNLDVCVSDFGLARDVYSSDYYRASKGARLPVKWMPPETLHDAVSNEKTDVVSSE